MKRSEQPADLDGFPLVIELPIQWGDQDAFGHVNNTVPIRWFESARIAYFRESGLSLLMSDKVLGPILASVTCNYRLQLFYPDTILVGASITRIGRTSMTMAHTVYSQARKAIAQVGDSVIVVFDYANNHPEPVTVEMRQTIEQIEGRTL